MSHLADWNCQSKKTFLTHLFGRYYCRDIEDNSLSICCPTSYQSTVIQYIPNVLLQTWFNHFWFCSVWKHLWHPHILPLTSRVNIFNNKLQHFYCLWKVPRMSSTLKDSYKKGRKHCLCSRVSVCVCAVDFQNLWMQGFFQVWMHAVCENAVKWFAVFLNIMKWAQCALLTQMLDQNCCRKDFIYLSNNKWKYQLWTALQVFF